MMALLIYILIQYVAILQPMQALVRGVTLRTEWAREDAAILMQSIYRGYRARVLLSQMIEQLIKEGELG